MSSYFDTQKERNRQGLASILGAVYLAFAPTGTAKAEVSQYVPAAVQLSSHDLQAEAVFNPTHVWQKAGKDQTRAFAVDPRNLRLPTQSL